MATLRTDDAARRLDFPVGPPLLKATFPVWAVFAAVSLIGWVVGGLLASALGGAPGVILLAALVPPLPAVALALLSKRWINRTTPLLYHLKTLRSEVCAPRPQPSQAVTRQTAVPGSLFDTHTTARSRS